MSYTAPDEVEYGIFLAGVWFTIVGVAFLLVHLALFLSSIFDTYAALGVVSLFIGVPMLLYVKYVAGVDL